MRPIGRQGGGGIAKELKTSVKFGAPKFVNRHQILGAVWPHSRFIPKSGPEGGRIRGILG